MKKVLSVLDVINGKKGAEGMLADRTLEAVPDIFGDDTLGQIGGFYKKLSPEVRAALRRDEIEVVIDPSAKLAVREKTRAAVDSNGRFIFRGMETLAADANWEFCFDQDQQPSYAETLRALEYAFQKKDFISAAQFEDIAEAKKQVMLADWHYANLFKGFYARPFAIALPSINIANKQLGEALDKVFLPAAERGYKARFPNRTFKNHQGTLKGFVQEVPDTRQDVLINVLRKRTVVVLWVFMNCLQGGSIIADRALIRKQSLEFLLGGTIVNSAVIAAYPQIVAKDRTTPTCYCAADSWQTWDCLLFGTTSEGLNLLTWNDLFRGYAHLSGSLAVFA